MHADSLQTELVKKHTGYVRHTYIPSNADISTHRPTVSNRLMEQVVHDILTIHIHHMLYKLNKQTSHLGDLEKCETNRGKT